MYRKKSPINFPLVSFLGQEYFLKSPRNIASEASNLEMFEFLRQKSTLKSEQYFVFFAKNSNLKEARFARILNTTDTTLIFYT